MTFDLENTVAQLRSRIRELCEQRDSIEMQLGQTNIALRSLIPLLEDANKREEALRDVQAARRKPAGLTEAISESLRSMARDSFSASEVREWLEREGFDLSDYSQPLATISVTLGRLAESGKVKAIRKGRNVTYQWIAG